MTIISEQTDMLYVEGKPIHNLKRQVSRQRKAHYREVQAPFEIIKNFALIIVVVSQVHINSEVE